MKYLNRNHPHLSLSRQCWALSLNRSSLYYKAKAPSDSDEILVNQIRDLWEQYPFYGYRRIHFALCEQGVTVNRKRVQRLMQEAGIQAIYPQPKTSIKGKNHRLYPYALKDIQIERPNQVWATDITYIKLPTGFVYLTAIMDIHSRYILSWRLSNSLSAVFCCEALHEALEIYGPPDIVNSDQGSQFTSDEWIYTLVNWGIQPSMTGVGRCNDNIHQERFWRTLKYENTFIYGYNNMADARKKIAAFIEFYNTKRPHMSLDYETPEAVYKGKRLMRGKLKLVETTLPREKETNLHIQTIIKKQNINQEATYLI